MLSKILTDFINKFFGDYFENLNTNQLNLSVWRGDVLLTDIHLKTSALDNYYLPFKIVAGKVGKVIMKIPWRNIYSLPVEVTLKDCEVLITPSLEMPYDPEKEEEEEYKRKMKTLESSLERAKLEGLSIDSVVGIPEPSKDNTEQAPAPGSTPTASGSGHPSNNSQASTPSEGTFVEKLGMHIFRNVQVKVDGIHIRYEDKISNPRAPLSLGIILTSLSIQTKDSNWNQLYITENLNNDTFNKLIDIKEFSVYMNSNVNLISATESSQEEMLTLIKEVNHIENPHSKYVIGPVSTQVKLRLTPSPESLRPPYSLPKIVIQTEMSELKLSLSNQQCDNFYRILETTEFISRARFWRKYRPNNVPAYKGYYTQWWRYAYNCVLDKVRNRRTSWGYQNISNHRSLCKTYYNACYEKMIQKKLSPELDEKLKQCEKKLDLFNLFLIRTRIEMIRKKHEQIENELKSQQSWFRKWLAVDITEAEIHSKVEESLTPEEKIKLNQAIGFNNQKASANAEPNTVQNYPRDYAEVKLQFSLKVLTMTVLYLPKRLFNSDIDEREILIFKIYNVETSTHVRPESIGFTFTCNIGDVGAETILGSMTQHQDQILEKIVFGTNGETNQHLVELVFEKSPLSFPSIGRRLKVNTSKVEIVYYANIVQELISCFEVPNGVELNMMRSNLTTRIQEMKESSSAKIKELVESNNDRLFFEINIAAPFFIIPQRGRLDESVRALIVDFGQIELRSLPAIYANSSQQPNNRSSSSKLPPFDATMKLTITNFQVLVVSPASPQLFNVPASQNGEGISDDGIKSFWNGLIGNVKKSINNFYNNQGPSTSTSEFHHNNQNLVEVVPSVTVEVTVVKSATSGAKFCKVNISDIFVRLSAWDFGLGLS